MATLEMSVDVPLTPEEAWAHTSDLSELDQWLTMHEAWRSQVPETLTVGTELSGVANVKGMRNRVTWTVQAADPPHRLALAGAGKGGTKFRLELRVDPKGDGSEVTIHVELGGRPLFGPIGSGVARAIKGDIRQSLDNFVSRHS